MDRVLSFRDLEVWQLGVPANVAEGWRRKKRRGAYQNHVSIAMGSQGELDTEMEIAFRNGFLSRESCRRTMELCTRVGLMLNRLHDSLDA
jgi:four helix bundle protein